MSAFEDEIDVMIAEMRSELPAEVLEIERERIFANFHDDVALLIALEATARRRGLTEAAERFLQLAESYTQLSNLARHGTVLL